MNGSTNFARLLSAGALHSATLKGALVCLLVASAANADQVVIQDYREARDRHFYNTLYTDGGTTIYCEAPFQGRTGLNVEHVYPASWMKETAVSSSLGTYGQVSPKQVSFTFALIK